MPIVRRWRSLRHASHRPHRGLTLLSGTLLALSLGQLAGRRSLLDGRAATILAVLATLGLIALLVRTMVI